MAKKIKIAGIDFGSKLAGTTAIAMLNEQQEFTIQQSQKKQDADEMLLEIISDMKPDLIALDAPLSLPAGVLSGKLNDDFFYRFADKKLKAMSPMFLGGLTARAMRLAAFCQQLNIELIEAYPAAFIQAEQLQEHYHKKDATRIPEFIHHTKNNFSFKLPELQNWHAIDACICLEIGVRKNLSSARKIGNQEGFIWY